MKLSEMKQKVLGLIEELNPESPMLTEDPDISAKINDVINQVMFELIRMKKLPKYIETNVHEGDILDFEKLANICGYEIYQIITVTGAAHIFRAEGTVIKFLESGKAEIDVAVYPEAITSDTFDTYEFELPADILEIMPYGAAADLLKSDESAEYGKIYDARYETMLQRLDHRWKMATITIEGGVNI